MSSDKASIATPGGFPIIGVGASAGGIEALEGFFRRGFGRFTDLPLPLQPETVPDRSLAT